MTHDPLCSWWSIQCDSDCAELPYGSSCKHMFCVCDLVSRAEARGTTRALDKARLLIAALVCPNMGCDDCEQYREALACIESLYGEEE